MPGSWDAAVRAGVVSFISVTAISLGSIVFAAFQGHALASDVAEYERKNDERIKVLEDERIAQAEFRGEVAAKLELLLKASSP